MRDKNQTGIVSRNGAFLYCDQEQKDNDGETRDQKIFDPVIP